MFSLISSTNWSTNSIVGFPVSFKHKHKLLPSSGNVYIFCSRSILKSTGQRVHIEDFRLLVQGIQERNKQLNQLQNCFKMLDTGTLFFVHSNKRSAEVLYFMNIIHSLERWLFKKWVGFRTKWSYSLHHLHGLYEFLLTIVLDHEHVKKSQTQLLWNSWFVLTLSKWCHMR